MFASKDVFLTPPSGGYTIARSVRLRSSASAYLNKTFGTPTDNKKWTMSMWLKRGSLGGSINIFGSVVTGGYFEFRFNTSDQIFIQNRVLVTNLLVANTTAVYRDPSAWYHIVFAFDSANATAANRNLLYVNGVNVALSANSGSGDACAFNSSGNTQYIGNSDAYTTFDGCLTEVNFIDGQALTPSSFGETDAITGVWKPKKYAGTYGTNGFYLNFSDNSSNTAATIGKDYSGNGNNWTPNNISVTAGATYDSMLDVPTPYADGGNGRGNYPVLNPLANGSATLSNGNLSVSGGNDLPCTMVCPSSGSWYIEFSKSNASAAAHVGIFDATSTPATINKSILYADTGGVYVNNSLSTTWATYASGDIISMNVDVGGGNIYFSKNNTYQGSVAISGSGISTSNIVIGVRCNTGVTADINFGQRPFTYPPSSPTKALNTFNLPDSTIKNGAAYMAATTYTGTSGNVSVVDTVNGIGFQPDFIWVKARSNAQGHSLVDAVRGTTSLLQSNTTSAELTLTNPPTFNSNGFTSTTDIHTNGYTYVAWQWKAGTTSASNTNGSITSTVSVGATQGFSVVTYTGNATNGATVGHGLGVSPSMIIGKIRSTTGDWYVWNTAMGDNVMRLNTTAAQIASTGNGVYNTGSFSSTVFALGSGASMNTNAATYVAYCFAAVKGFSAFGSYTGNGSTDGPFVYTGFRPRFVLTKRTDNLSDWNLHDTSRDPYNVAPTSLFPNTSNADTTPYYMDINSNGFKIRDSGSSLNTSSGTYIYMCFAENPFKNSLAR